MIEEIVLEDANKIIRQHPTVDSLEEGLDAAISFALENKRAALHLYHSSSRDIYEQYLWHICEYVAATYFNTAFAEYPVDKKDKDIIIRYYKWICFGAIVDWLNGGMKDDVQVIFRRLSRLKKGMTEEMVRRSISGEN